MANDMVTRCARALDPFLSGVHAFDAGPPEYRAKCREAARAVIEAMREPTYEMRLSIPPRLGEMAYRDIGDLWKAMIKAALSQEDRE
ncbi:hypothetical protein BSL82_09595 [Tardibacter chloracetimidivorans]|uniref:Uncharacterized protein n=1 Tax=Tardibacter chloracetimidivorans TaxID=1921510 RepID=A0A1L3ZV55_9SPHN|nr:hypothetical protein [Tardibacter chloracetimidivorans]API59534.1 hypothetical protein BSL82_09595 [Tardibacter chloracetimidivorans]